MDYLSLLCVLDISTDTYHMAFLQSSFNSLNGTITIVEERLSILEGIVRTLIRRTDSSGNLEVRKLAWLKKKGKAEALLQELQI